jgi:hypothetical protein
MEGSGSDSCVEILRGGGMLEYWVKVLNEGSRNARNSRRSKASCIALVIAQNTLFAREKVEKKDM